MKAYRVELLVVDHDGIGPDVIVEELESGRYANDCIVPKVKKITEKDVGEWSDDHPLNKRATCDAEYLRLFAPDDNLAEMPAERLCGRCYARGKELFPTACAEKPEEHIHEPLGMYHCPDCGAMLLAGMPHPEVCELCRDKKHPEYDAPLEPKPEPGLGAMW